MSETKPSGSEPTQSAAPDRPLRAVLLDPHPYGCPIGVRATPAEMSELVIALCVKSRDLLEANFYVINPSKGQSYPVVFLRPRVALAGPAIALFPAWEDDARTRRLDYGRQVTLLQRIAAAGVPGESVETYAPTRRSGDGKGGPPLLIPLAVAIAEVVPLFQDLHERLGIGMRMTITAIPLSKGRPDLPVARSYAGADTRARLVWFPGWADPGDKQLIDHRRMELLLQRAEQRTVPEVPADAVFNGS